MAETEQQQVIEFLSATLAMDGAPPNIITTHISVIFLSGTRAFKLKRAVKFPFLDFTTLEARHQACLQEVEINRRTAPSIYKGVVPITEQNGTLAMNGRGKTIEWLVEMVRFDEATLFDRLAGIEKGLRRPLIENLADTIATFHAKAEIKRHAGGAPGIRKIAENNIRAFKLHQASGILDPAQAEAVTAKTLGMIDKLAGVLDKRRDVGRVRACHGDLHLRNICLVDGQPTLFDAIEFSSEFSEIDVLYDLAFLLMDLDFHGKRRLSAFLFNRYLDVGDEQADTFNVLPVFLTMRAQIRAHVGAAIAASQSDPEGVAREATTAQRYLDLAETYLNDHSPQMVAVGGLSGSGKSRLAREIAPYIGRAPGARVVRTDVVRKRLSGTHPNESLGAEGYTPEMTVRTYQTFIEQARDAINNGQSVVLDAVFAKREQRLDAEALADECKIPFTGIWVDAPEEVRIQRVSTRKRNVSDVTVEVAQQQSGYNLGDMTWARIDSSGKKSETVKQAIKVLKI
ncbi:AAA family ATPase [Thalassospiraceae bacterium LMO-JJ14]|nr:AAA family ATPase [Thalassospiraceae bacterium LMO-JJ14]